VKWTQEDIAALRAGYVTWPPDINAIADKLNKTKPSVKLKAAHLGLCKCILLKESEIAFIKQNSDVRSVTELSLLMGRSWNTIRMALRLNGIKPFKPSNKWIPSKVEIEYLKVNQEKPLKVLSAHLKRSMPSISKFMKAMGWIRPKVIKLKPLGPPKPPRVKKEKIVKKVVVKAPVMAPVVPRDAGTNRIREAMERINRI